MRRQQASVVNHLTLSSFSMATTNSQSSSKQLIVVLQLNCGFITLIIHKNMNSLLSVLLKYSKYKR